MSRTRATLVLLAMIVAGFAVRGHASAGEPVLGQLVVNSAAGSGDGTCDATCTFRDAIGDANDSAGLQEIVFDTNVFVPPENVIALESGLPEIDGADGVVIRGGPGGVVLDGSKLKGGENGVQVTSGSESASLVEIYGITIRGFPGNGLSFCAGELPACSENASELVFNSITTADNAGHGIHVKGAHLTNVELRGCNVQRSAMNGVNVEASGTLESLIVTSCTSSMNTSQGIFAEAGGSIVDLLLEDVVLTENGFLGAYFDSVDETVNPTIDNVDASNNGTMGLGFSSAQPLSGLQFVNSTIDGNGTGVGNGLGTEILAYQVLDSVVTGNSFSNNEASSPFGGVGFQIYSQFEGPSGIEFRNNRVVGNVGPGVSVITDTPGEKEVDASVFAENEISGNTGNGFQVNDSRRITISNNRIFANGGIGIDLQGGEVKKESLEDVTPNDPGDDDDGANDLLNFPEFSSQSGTSVSGTACAGCTVEVFESDSDPSGHGEGRRMIGGGVAAGGGAFAIAVCGVGSGDEVTATATDADGNTSEFSENFAITISPEPCEGDSLQGDVDCDSDIDSVDALKVLRHVASLAVAQTEPCDDIGTGVGRVASAGSITGVGDVDCDNDVDSVDALKILRHVASLSVSQTDPCRDIGT